jgi:hypothetical protein
MSSCSIEAVKRKMIALRFPRIAHPARIPISSHQIHIPPSLSMFSSRSHTLELIQVWLMGRLAAALGAFWEVISKCGISREERDQSYLHSQRKLRIPPQRHSSSTMWRDRHRDNHCRRSFLLVAVCTLVVLPVVRTSFRYSDQLLPHELLID